MRLSVRCALPQVPLPDLTHTHAHSSLLTCHPPPLLLAHRELGHMYAPLSLVSMPGLKEYLGKLQEGPQVCSEGSWMGAYKSIRVWSCCIDCWQCLYLCLCHWSEADF